MGCAHVKNKRRCRVIPHPLYWGYAIHCERSSLSGKIETYREKSPLYSIPI